jgi:hypothetical protein
MLKNFLMTKKVETYAKKVVNNVHFYR